MASARRRRPSPPSAAPVPLAGGRFQMGSNRHYPAEGREHTAEVGVFSVDPYPATNAEYARFVAATGYQTVAERPLDAAFPGVAADRLAPGSLVFRRTRGPVDLRDIRQWWVWTQDASWRHGAEYAWGDEFAPGGRAMASTWWGKFPYRRLRTKGYDRTSPVGSFPANGYGLFDMIGNVWEWTTDWYAPRHATSSDAGCCGPEAPRGGAMEASFDPAQPSARVPRRVVKGGSFLCASSYCRRYRPAARHAQMVDSGMSHIGFRCIVKPTSNHDGE